LIFVFALVEIPYDLLFSAVNYLNKKFATKKPYSLIHRIESIEVFRLDIWGDIFINKRLNQ